MEVIVAPYRVTDIDSNEARVISNVEMIEEGKQGYTLVFSDKQSYNKANLSIHSVCRIGGSEKDFYIVVQKESLMAVLL